MMASSQSLAMIHLRMSLSPEPAPPVNSGEPLKTMASREPCLCAAFGFTGPRTCSTMCCRNKQRAVVHARQAGAEAAVEAVACRARCTMAFCCFFQSTPKGGLLRK
jgi:hypothetical protein